MNKLTVIFDLDGTLAIIDKRRAVAAKPDGKIHWGKFFDPQNIQLDEPNVPVIEAFKAMKTAGYRVGIFSGRDAISRTETEQWLADNGIQPDFLRMRPQRSFTKDDILKKQWLDEEMEMGHQIMCTFDDRDKVVKMWRDNGIICFQVAPGDF
jgi:phosphoglycolate phosphatase-like HAD superfamily hydrolase